MSSPTDGYLQRDRLVRLALKEFNLGGLETKFEDTTDDDFDDNDFVDVSEYVGKEKTDEADFADIDADEDIGEDTSISMRGLYHRKIGEAQILSTFPPNRVGFYQGNKKIGELYFTEDPMRVVELDNSFKQYADELRKKLGI